MGIHPYLCELTIACVKSPLCVCEFDGLFSLDVQVRYSCVTNSTGCVTVLSHSTACVLHMCDTYVTLYHAQAPYM